MLALVSTHKTNHQAIQTSRKKKPANRPKNPNKLLAQKANLLSARPAHFSLETFYNAIWIMIILGFVFFKCSYESPCQMK